MFELIGAQITEIDTVPEAQPDYSILTLVSNPELYRRMVESFLRAGFTKDRCEFIFADNRAGNKADGFSGLNRMLARSRGRIVIAAHQDLIANDPISVLDAQLQMLSARVPGWAVAGNAGRDLRQREHLFLTDRHSLAGFELPAFPKVEALDENFLVIRREANIGWSADLAGFHLYGTDLVQQARLRGFSAHVIGFRLEHTGLGAVDAHFFEVVEAFQEKYRTALQPRAVQTPVIKLGIGQVTAYQKFWQSKLKRKSLHGSSPGLLRRVYNRMDDLRDAAYRRRNGGGYRLEDVIFSIGDAAPRSARKALRRGFYEAPERNLVRKWLPKDQPVIELGGSFGVVSSLLRRHLAEDQPLIVLEANPALIPICEDNIRAGGGRGPVQVYNRVLAYSGEADVGFVVTEGLQTSHVAQPGETAGVIRVPATTLEKLLAEGRIEADYALVCDIEGYEYDLLLNDAAALRRATIVVVEVHMDAFYARSGTVTEFLAGFAALGFEQVDAAGTVVVLRRTAAQRPSAARRISSGVSP